MDISNVTFLNDEFENSQTGEKVEGITVIIDGDLREVLYGIAEKRGSYANVTELFRDALAIGIAELMK